MIAYNILGPILVGILAYVDLTRTYTNALTSFIRSIIDMEAPLLRGKGDLNRENKLISQGLLIYILLNVCISILIALFAFISKDELQATALYIFCFSSIVFQLFGFFSIIIRNNLQIRFLSIITVINSVLVGVISIYFALSWSLKGFLVGQGIATLLIVSIMWIRVRVWPSLNVEHDIFKLIFTKGIWLGAGGIIYSFFIELDRLVVLLVYPTHIIGYYAIVLLVYNTVMVMPNALYSPYIPVFMQALPNQDMLEAKRMVINKTATVMAVMLPIIVIIYWMIPPFVNHFLPQFVNGVKIAQIGVFRIMGVCLMPLAFSIFSYKEKQFKLFVITGLAFILGTGLIIVISRLTLDPFITVGLSNIWIMMYCVIAFLYAAYLIKFSFKNLIQIFIIYIFYITFSLVVLWLGQVVFAFSIVCNMSDIFAYFITVFLEVLCSMSVIALARKGLLFIWKDPVVNIS